ncbi:MAG: FAD-dependent oxidoreductase [Tissierellia bacterium]|nr:FAD-dependent oxidoreductase [Tissierellia bacterium]
MSKYLVVGGVAGGMSTAARIKRLDPKAEVIVYEKGPHVSYSNCCLPYHLSGLIEPAEKLILMTPEKLKAQYNLNVFTNSEVIDIDPKAKKITVKDTVKGEESKESYDYLILSPGAKPIKPQSIEGIHGDNVFTIRNVVDIDALKQYLETQNIKKVAVIGGGFIGIEACENLVEGNFEVSMIEASNQVMGPFDYDMVQILHKELVDHGVELVVEDGLEKIEDKKIILQSGKELEAEAVVLAIGVSPDTALAKKAGLEIGETGGILVNHHYQTSDPHIYAVGDAIEVTHLQTQKKTKLALAGPAQRQARAAADHIYGKRTINKGVIGSSVVQCFSLNAARTGLNEKEIQKEGIEYDFSYVIPMDKVGLMPDKNPIFLKLIFQVPTGKILGAQAIGKGNVEKRIDVVAAMITMGADIEDLKELELCYAPPFSTAKDPVNMAAIVAENLLQGEFKQVHVDQVRKLWEKGATIIDVREPGEYEQSHIKGVENIPLSEFRERLDEIPKDEPVYLHCRSGQRSYFVTNELTKLGWTNVYNVAGSYLGICLYEYYNDQRLHREKIVTEYNFN